MVNQRGMRYTFAVLCLLLAGDISLAQQRKPASVTPAVNADLMTLDAQRAFITQYCSECHNDSAKIGGMTLTSLDLAHVDQSAELAEKVIKKLRTGLMPPAASSKRPDRETAKAFIKTLETQI